MGCREWRSRPPACPHPAATAPRQPMITGFWRFLKAWHADPPTAGRDRREEGAATARADIEHGPWCGLIDITPGFLSPLQQTPSTTSRAQRQLRNKPRPRRLSRLNAIRRRIAAHLMSASDTLINPAPRPGPLREHQRPRNPSHSAYFHRSVMYARQSATAATRQPRPRAFNGLSHQTSGSNLVRRHRQFVR